MTKRKLSTTKLAKTLREVPMDHVLKDTDWTIADLCDGTPIKLFVVDTTAVHNRGGELFIVQFADDHFECEWTQGSGSETSMADCITYIRETMCF